ncbi:hypothetical protein [Streptomyces sp. NPDC007905]|uniref:hypothetical protein n=1 Tax=Streptomyces sp. NPDC007905 TaxID=3364788 RepID=UPI0036EFD444
MTDRHGESSAHLPKAATGVIERSPKELKPEIYTLSFRIRRVDDDDLRPYVAVGYNTENQYEREKVHRDRGEARWYCAGRLLDGFEMLGRSRGPGRGAPVEGGRGARAAVRGEGSRRERDVRREVLGTHFADAWVEPARRLHADGRIEKVFGRPLPVVIFDMYCPGWEVEATTAANPPELIEGFLKGQRAAEEA